MSKKKPSSFNKIEISAAPQKVWDTISNFHDLSWAPGVVESLEKIGSASGDEVGAARLINGVFKETLTAIDSAGLTFTYSMDDGPGPVAAGVVDNYIGVVKISESGGGTAAALSSSPLASNASVRSPVARARASELPSIGRCDGRTRNAVGSSTIAGTRAWKRYRPSAPDSATTFQHFW